MTTPRRSRTAAAKTGDSRRPASALGAVALLAWLSLASGSASAQRYLVHTYTEADGLPSSSLRGLDQGPSGQIWFATRSGVAVYDGLEWVVYDLNDGLPVLNQGFLRFDSRGVPWSLGRRWPLALSFFDGTRWIPVASPESGPAAGITAMEVVDGDGGPIVAVGDDAGRLFLWDGESWIQRGAGSAVNALAVAGGRLLIATPDGVLSWAPSSGGPQPLAGAPPRATLGLAPDVEAGRVWLVGPDWIGRLADGRFEPLAERIEIPFANDFGRLVCAADANGGLYLGHPRTLSYFDPRNGLEQLDTRAGLVSGGASDLLLDREHDLWVANVRGASKIVSRRFASYRREHGLLRDEVTAVLERRSGEIVLGHESGLSFMGPKPRSLDFSDGRQQGRVLDLAEDGEGRLWVAANERGLASVGVDRRVVWHPAAALAGEVRSVLVDRRGKLWVAATNGVVVGEGARFEPVPLCGEEPYVRRLFEGASGAIYGATPGLGVLRLLDGSCEVWQSAGRVDSNDTFAVLEREQGEIWVGTSAGLLGVDRGSLIKPPAGGPRIDRPVYFLVRGKGGPIWIGTDNGVMRWQDDGLRHFTIRDGLIGGETNRAGGLVDAAGKLWIGTEQGLSVYHPEWDRPSGVRPRVELSWVDVAGQRLPLDREVELPHRRNTLVFRYRAISFVDEHRILVRSRLEGFDPDWAEPRASGGQEIRYTNLPAGSYRFHLKAANADGEWSEVISSAPIRIRRPFWLRPWFYTVLAVGAGALAYGAHSVRASRRRARAIEAERAERLEALGILAGGIAHDFNNLLTVVLGHLELLQRGGRRAERDEPTIDAATTATLRARDLAQQLLTFSRGGAPMRQVASVPELIQQSSSFVLSGSNVLLELDLPDDIWAVEIDAAQMNQVVSNLLLNAAQSMPQGGTCRIRARNVERAPLPLRQGRYVMIELEDQGQGILSEHLDRVFDPYFSTKPGGSGLGLATAYSIVRKHDGNLVVESTPGVGSTFRIYLPVTRKEAGPRPRELRPPEAGSGRVLVMDDEEPVRTMMGSMLIELGYSVDYAEDGEHAIAAYRRELERGQPFDAVIMDLTIPGRMGGTEAVRRLRQIDPRAKAIVVSGYSNDPVMASHADYGFCGRVAKPFGLAELAAVLQQVLGEGVVKGVE